MEIGMPPAMFILDGCIPIYWCALKISAPEIFSRYKLLGANLYVDFGGYSSRRREKQV